MSTKLPVNLMEPMAEYYPKDWNIFCKLSISGKQPVHLKEGEWYPDHILSWYPYRNDDNVLFLMYEEIKKRSDEEINQIAEATSFENMKKKGVQLLSNVNFFRKGQIADWKNHFTVAQSELIDEKFNEKLSGIDIKFSYK
ncbi:sulfotransferase 1C2-like [Clavelina lepadiformis]|uniref:sulfotransferase 1C2-like n=1 Tax=Clavelina lepadiformis TaxID=159417 RepID=UPI004041B84E